jgi:putative endonuclease
MSSVSRGQKGEKLAEDFLLAKGYTILAKNWRGQKGQRTPEIDIVARDKDAIVFVEVKTASTGDYGSPEYWITPAKRKRLIAGAEAYLAQNSTDQQACRFDAIVIDNRTKTPLVKHIINAFMA